MAVNASILKGTRDFNPDEVQRREYIINVIKQVYLKYGFRPIETPALERLDTLTGKYGDEGDQLLFKVLNNGDFLKKVNQEDLEERNSKEVSFQISKRGLRYDLTVPFARYVAMNQNDIAFPFKRYQIQSVWRGDRPQKGRYQEFTQCDADVIGTDSLWCESEFLLIYDEVFSKLQIPVTIRLNNRKILAGIARHFGLEDRFIELTTILDKWDKVGRERVAKEVIDLGLGSAEAERLLQWVSDPDGKELRTVEDNLIQEGMAELDEILEGAAMHAFKNTVAIDLKLARGLSYYTGAIFEVTADEVHIGSISGGGRYDDLTGVFGLKGTSGVGISFGLARIYDVLVEMDAFPAEVAREVDLLFLAMDQDSLRWSYDKAYALRQKGLKIDVYPELSKFKKLMKYADRRGVQRVAIIGSAEREEDQVSIKDMQSGNQERIEAKALYDYLKGEI